MHCQVDLPVGCQIVILAGTPFVNVISTVGIIVDLSYLVFGYCSWQEEESLLRFFRRAICLRKQHGDAVSARTVYYLGLGYTLDCA